MCRELLAGEKQSGNGYKLTLKQLAEVSRWSRELTVKTGGYAGIRNECMPKGMKLSGNT
jgi:hypothetical protein